MRERRISRRSWLSGSAVKGLAMADGPTYSVDLKQSEIELLRMVVDEMSKFFFHDRSYFVGNKGAYSYKPFKHWRELAQADTKLFEALPSEIQQAYIAERERSEEVGRAMGEGKQ